MGVYLISGILGRFFLAQARAADSLAELMSLTQFGLALDAVGIVSAFLALRVVQGISRKQQAWADSTPALVPAVP